MDNTIESSIQARRDALYAHYDLPPDAREKAEALFARMEEFGRRCRDRADFEEKFATQTLSREFNNLFVEFTAYVKTPEGTLAPGERMTEIAAEGARSAARHRAEMEVREAITEAMPDELHKWRTYGIYNIPVLGRIVGAFNNMENISRLFGRRKKRRNVHAEDGQANKPTETKKYK